MTPNNNGMTRRSVSLSILAAAAVTPLPALAGRPEMDSYGNLFTPKAEMLTGGSSAARGIASRERGSKLKAGQAVQSVYETRFIAYLSRFLLNFDPAANAWWRQNSGEAVDWAKDEEAPTPTKTAPADFKFSEFAESVEVGLADYFVGPYGSYSSVQAAKAGISASAPALSSRQASNDVWFLQTIFSPKKSKASDSNKQPPNSQKAQKQGVLNLFTLLKARYTTVAAKRQLAILFSFISTPELQPTQEIRGLLGEVDNATISELTLIRPLVEREDKSRTSSRRGGGYTLEAPPEIVVQVPPALGSEYRPAQLQPILKPTSRVLSIRVLDGGEGYTSPPQVSVQGLGASRQCQASAILDRRGQVAQVLVLDPGYGYGKQEPPKIKIAPPKGDGNGRPAKAEAELEYEIADIELVAGGNGFVQTEPPKIAITPPAVDPDWFMAVQAQPEMRMIPVSYMETLKVEVQQMKNADGTVVFGGGQQPEEESPLVVTKALVQRLQREPLELLPSNVVLRLDEESTYRVASLPPIPPNAKVPSPRYRAFDPIFGGVGSVPVSKVALALRPGEYGRLALSGAVCTVLVRTALNPLELIKTKQQLENDEELFDFCRDRMMRKKKTSQDDPGDAHEGGSTTTTPAQSSPALTSGNNNTATSVLVERETAVAVTTHSETKEEELALGTTDLIFSLAELRGPMALFQSADITFLASLMFGSFGFGATELFRRSFTETFFSDVNGSSAGGSEVVLLVAAALATVVTSAAATPFEVLRVKSMILLESVGWTEVLRGFVEQNGGPSKKDRGNEYKDTEFSLSDLAAKDVLPLWAGFGPTLSRELPFAIVKFLAFDILARLFIDLINAQTQEGALPVQVGVGPAGLAVSAIAGALAGIAGAIVSHPADLILTKTSASKAPKVDENGETSAEESKPSWVAVLRDLLSQDGGIANLFVGLPARSIFFFLVIGLQFFLYDYVKNVFQVGTDDLSLVLDVFYAVRAGLVEMDI